ncbi:MAG TPA: hypothetical protein VFH68_25850 [Polyangia bacterium]|nr:hypothetical protein [Polyangia bacterium]
MTVPSDAEIGERLRAILAAPEFQQAQEPVWWRAFKRIVHGLLDWLEGQPAVVRWGLLLLALALLAAIAIHLFITFRQVLREAPLTRRGDADPQVTRTLSSEDLLAEARALRSAGRLREAARALQQARLLLECRRRAVPWRATLADWEWIDELGRPADLIEFTRATQTIAFGASPSLPAVEACEGRLLAELAGSPP